MPIKYIGRKTTFEGRPLWEILGNLKDFGVGRIVIRNKFQRYPEPSYMKILKVAALPQPTETYEDRKVIALVERTFRGKLFPIPVQIDRASYKADYALVPKDEEHKYLSSKPLSKDKILPRTMDFPPFLKRLIVQQKKSENVSIDENLKLTIAYNLSGFKDYKIAKEGEKPTVEYTMGLGEPISPELYANIKKQ